MPGCQYLSMVKMRSDHSLRLFGGHIALMGVNSLEYRARVPEKEKAKNHSDTSGTVGLES